MEKTAKTDNFLKAIYKYAEEQRNTMRTEVEQLKEEKIKEARKKGKLDSEKYIKDRLEEKRHAETGRLAKEMQEGQRSLFLERAKMTDNVFKKAEEKLIEYTKTPQYTEKLIESAKKISEFFGDNSCVVYVNEKDLGNAAEISAEFNGNAEVLADSSVKIGGLKSYCEAMSIVADETLDSKLYAQREWFIENSGLSVL
ncbi:MAG: hypothetical protein LUF33_03330 [Clostridiales bacterium]|nr:hypothetical protein [Clostridiales bacterium]